MTQKLRFALVLLGMSGTSLNAQTQITVKSYRDWKAAETKCKLDPACSAQGDVEKSASSTYLKGTGDGFVWANGLLDATQRDRLYCAPEKLGLNSNNYDQILESYLPKMTEIWKTLKHAEWKSVDDAPVGFALLLALIDAFPCGTAAKH